ncbi:g10512 [Coccomyxa elongata]
MQVQQACEALSTRLDDSKAKGKPTKGFKLSNVKRLTAEIPVADDSPTSVVSLAEDLLKGLAPELASSVTLVFGDVEAALLASTKVQNQVVALDDAPDEPLVGPLLIVGPSAGQLGEAEELLRKWRGRVVILLNPEWAEGQSVPSNHTAFVKSFEVVYCFQPIAIQAFIVTTTQGAVSKRVVKGQSGQAPWQILKQGWGNNWKIIGQMQRRPTSQDLELAFLNASAAESPITAGIKAVKQLAPSKKK